MRECIFCRIARKELPAEIVLENGSVLAFKDTNPQAPVHVLVIPKRHIGRLLEVEGEDLPVLTEIHGALQGLAKKLHVDQNGFRVVVNNGPDAGQAVDHLHYHFLAGRKLSWPPG